MTDLKLFWFLMAENTRDLIRNIKCMIGLHTPVKMVNYRNGKITVICKRCGKILN